MSLIRERLDGLCQALLSGIRKIEGDLAAPAEPNSKIRNGNWADVQGLTYLFESSESKYEPYGPEIVRLRTDRGDGLLNQLGGVAQALGHELRHYRLKLLPTDTYHVTYRDVVSDLDLSDLPREHAEYVAQRLKRLPNDLSSVAKELSLPATKLIDPIVFRADELTVWGGGILVVTLRPADMISADRFEALCRERAQENAEWMARYGRVFRSDYTPHVSLGYFQDLALGRRVEENGALLNLCRSIARDMVGDTTLTVARWSLHAFVDMATFVKLT